jgi:2-oxoglutarate ferredoxin oxidoreductase subunit gamma
MDFRIAGSGGQGVILLSVILAEAYGMYENFEIAQTQSYGPEARGGACRAELVVSDDPIDFVKVDKIRYFVVFNEVAFKKYAGDIGEETIIFADSSLVSKEMMSKYPNVFAIDATDIASKNFDVMSSNIVMLGFLAAKLPHIKLSSAKEALKRLVPPVSLQTNLAALQAGYERGKADGSV